MSPFTVPTENRYFEDYGVVMILEVVNFILCRERP